MSLSRNVMCGVLALSGAVGLVAPSHAQLVTASVTVDNVYALYSGTPSALTLIGSNGDWRTAENYSFNASPGSFVYVAGWDQSGIQGFQGVAAGPGGIFRTNLTDWVAAVVTASVLPGWTTAGSVAPPIGALQTALSSAAWLPLLASRPHAAGPWGSVVNDPLTQWVWRDDIDGGTTDGSLVVFRTASVVTAVPEPSSALMMLVGAGLMGFLYRRRMHQGGQT